MSASARWSVRLAVAAAALLVALCAAFAAGREHAGDLADVGVGERVVGLGAWLLALCGAGALATGVVSLARDHAHRGPVVAATVVGAFVTALVVQQALEGSGVLGG